MMEYLDNIALNPTDLIVIYNKWIKDPQLYEKDMIGVIDKVIHTRLKRTSMFPIYRRIEDEEDLIQDLRFFCFRKLANLKNPTNKRIYNYLRVSLDGYLKDKTERVGKFLDREDEVEIDHQVTCDPLEFYFTDPLVNKVATMLSSGFSGLDIRTDMNLTKTQYSKIINKIKIGVNNEKIKV